MVTSNGDKKSFLYALIGFLFPVIGLIVYLVKKDTMPLKAKSAGKGALVSVIISVVFGLIGSIIPILLA